MGKGSRSVSFVTFFLEGLLSIITLRLLTTYDILMSFHRSELRDGCSYYCHVSYNNCHNNFTYICFFITPILLLA